MALNGNLNNVLSNVVSKVSPVIKLSNGLYTIVPFYTIVPTDSENLGTNLSVSMPLRLIGSIELIGTWSSSDQYGDYYEYDNDNNIWHRYYGIK